MENNLTDKLKVYVAADSMISSLGFSTAENMAAIRRCESGIALIDDETLYRHPFLGAALDKDRLRVASDAAGINGYTILEQLLILSMTSAIDEAGIDPAASDCILVFSTTKGNIDALSGTSGIPADSVYLWMAARSVARYFASPHTPVVISNACISGVSALVTAARLLESGHYRHAVVVGADLLSGFVVTGFESFRSISKTTCRPYDRDRDGLTLGEACGAVVLTSDRSFIPADSRPVLVEGGAITNDANHISGPSRTGDGLAAAIAGALAETSLCPDDISFINAHGTATHYNDEMESKAIGLTGMSGIPVNSLKSYWGHTLGAAGIVESIACFWQLKHNILFGTKGFVHLGVPESLDVRAEHCDLEMKRCVKTASGFGGCNAAVVYTLEPFVKDKAKVGPGTVSIERECLIADNRIEIDGHVVFETDENEEFGSFIRQAYKGLDLSNLKFFKMDDLSKLGYVTAEYLLRGIAPFEVGRERRTGILLANSSSSLHTDRIHQQTIEHCGEEGASPAVFVYTLPNVMMGEICIRHKIRGENTFFIAGTFPRRFLELQVKMLMEQQKLDACIFGWCDLMGETYRAEFYWTESKK